MRVRIIAVVALSCALASTACGDAGSGGPSSLHPHVRHETRVGQADSHAHETRTTRNEHRSQRDHKSHRERESKASPARKQNDDVCPTGDVLSGVYHPYRLNVLDACRAASGTIAEVIHEEDGDLHLYLDLDRASLALAPSGMLTVELMPRDGGHLPAPSVGDHVRFVGAWSWDGDHNWRELHPVWSESFGGKTFTSGPRFGGAPPYADFASAARLCRTPAGALCRGYGAVAPVAKPPKTKTAHGSGCNPNYGPVCVPNSAADLDCPDVAFHDFRVTGADVYGFDGDDDHIACES